MLLQPRKFQYKTRQKVRSVAMAGEATLTYGDSGLRILQPLRLTGRRIFRLKIFLKKAARKPDLTKRRVWLSTFPHTPLTKKGKGMRMGKGIGKLSAWQIKVRGGVFVAEFKGLRPGRAAYFAKQVANRFCVRTRFCFKSNYIVNLHGASRASARLTSAY